MSNFMSNYFGPLNKHSCMYFLIITIIFFILLVIVILSEIFWIFKNFKQLNFRTLTGAVLIIFNVFLAYFVNRLLYTMCTKSLS